MPQTRGDHQCTVVPVLVVGEVRAAGKKTGWPAESTRLPETP
jgi:hypothetical protein